MDVNLIISNAWYTPVFGFQMQKGNAQVLLQCWLTTAGILTMLLLGFSTLCYYNTMARPIFILKLNCQIMQLQK